MTENSTCSISFDIQDQRLIVGPTNLTIQVPDGARVVNAKGELLVPANANTKADDPLKAQEKDVHIGRFLLRDDGGEALTLAGELIMHDLYAYPHPFGVEGNSAPLRIGQAAKELLALEKGQGRIGKLFANSFDFFEAIEYSTYAGEYYIAPFSIAQKLMDVNKGVVAEEIKAHPDRLYGTSTPMKRGYFACISPNQPEKKKTAFIEDRVYWWPVRSVIITLQP